MLWKRWILPTIQKEWSVARRYVDGIIGGKLCYTEALAPQVWVQFDVRPQEVLQHTNRQLTLTICLRVKRCARSEIRPKYLEKLRPELASEPWISI